MTVATQPRVLVEVDGGPMDPAAVAALVEVVVERRPSTPACLTLIFAADTSTVDPFGRAWNGSSRNGSGGLGPGPAPIGTPVSVAVGSDHLFEGTTAGRTTTWDRGRGPTVAIRAYDRLHDLRGRRRVSAFQDLDAIEIIARLIEPLGLAVDDRTGLAWPRRVHHQYGETDLAFIRRLLAPGAASIQLDGEVVAVVADPDVGALPSISFDPAADLSSLSIDERADHEPDLSVGAWWPQSPEATGTPGDDGSRRAGRQLSDAGARLLHRGVELHNRRHRLVAQGVAESPTHSPIDNGRRLRPGTIVELPEPTDRADSGRADSATVHRLLATVVTHRLTATGHRTEFSTEPTDGPPTPPPATTTLGRVVDLDDPLGRSRVRLALVAFDDLETDWLPVLGLGSGQDRGVVAVPAPDDLALVIGPLDDPAAGVVLGGLPAGSILADDPTEGGHSRRIVARLPGGARLLLDADVVELEDGRGSSLRLSEDQVRLHAVTDLEVAAPGRAMVLTADTIDFRRS